MPFIRVNCAAPPEILVENELFVYEIGPFAGADRSQIETLAMPEDFAARSAVMLETLRVFLLTLDEMECNYIRQVRHHSRSRISPAKRSPLGSGARTRIRCAAG